MGFLTKTDFFLKLPNAGKLAAECVFKGIVSEKCGFGPSYEVSIRKFSKLETLENMMPKVFVFEKKKRFPLLKSLL